MRIGKGIGERDLVQMKVKGEGAALIPPCDNLLGYPNAYIKMSNCPMFLSNNLNLVTCL